LASSGSSMREAAVSASGRNTCRQATTINAHAQQQSQK
jgi:hypothetical protein